MAFDNIVSQEADEYTVTISTELNGRTVTQTVEKFPMGSQEEDEEVGKEMEVHEDGGGGEAPAAVAEVQNKKNKEVGNKKTNGKDELRARKATK